MIVVYHSQNFRDCVDFMLSVMLSIKQDQQARVARLLAENAYKRVAALQVDDLEEAFVLTNTITRPWYNNPDITLYNGRQHRSTSVGDLMLHNNKVFLVDNFGFTELNIPASKLPTND